MFPLPFLIFFISIVVICVVKILSKSFDYFEKRGIKYVKPYPLIGTNFWLLQKKSFPVFILENCKKFRDEKIFGLFDFQKPVIVINNPEVIKQITVKDFEHFTDRRTFLNPKSNNVVANLLITMKGKKWHEMRVSLTPIFTTSKMRLMFELISNCGQQLVKNLKIDCEGSKDGRIYDMKDLSTKFACDVISSCAFGYQSDSFQDPNNDFYNLGKGLLIFRSPKMMFKILLMRYAPMVSKFLGVSMFDPKAARHFYQLIVTALEEREKSNEKRPDLINLLAQLKKGGLSNEDEKGDADKTQITKRTWSNDELIAQCFVFFFAGFETVSSLLVFAAYELAKNTDIQMRLLDEIRIVQERLGQDNLVTYEAIHGMKYMDMVVSEALRKWPPAPLLDRVCTKPYEFSHDGLNFKIDEGDLVWIPLYSIHHNADHYPEPEKFDPERFSDKMKSEINSSTYLPFGIGPRICIGSRFALLEVKTLLYYILSKFTLELSSETPVPVKLMASVLSITPEKPIMIKLKPLNE